MGLRPTHRDESALLTARLIPNGLCNDFRRSVMAIFRQLTCVLVNHFLEEDTLRTNEYGLRASSGSSGHPLPDAFASCESLLMSVGRMASVTSRRDLSKVLAPIAFK